MGIEAKIDELIASMNALTEALGNSSAASASNTSAAPSTPKGAPEKKEEPVVDLKALKKEAIKLGADRDDVINLRKPERVQEIIDELKSKATANDDLDLDLDEKSQSAEEDDLGLDMDEPEEVVDLKTVKMALGEVINTKGKDALMKIFQKFGVKNANNLEEKDFAAVYKAAKAAVA